MDDIIVIIGVKPKLEDVNTDLGKCTYRFNYEKEVYEVNRPITRRPLYVAVRDADRFCITRIFWIDQAKSVFEKGMIVPESKPLVVDIPLRVKDPVSARDSIWYASFGSLITHSTTDEFVEEKSQTIARVIAEDKRILCNGYDCPHFSYCKFFHHTQAPAIMSSELKSGAKSSP